MSGLAAVVRAELFKSLRKRRIFVLAALLWLLLPALLLLLGRLLKTNLGGSFIDEGDVVGTLIQELSSPFGVSRAVLVAPALLSPTFYMIAIALFAGFLIGEEKSHNMWKTVLVAHPQRLGVLAGKLTVAMLLLGLLLGGGLLTGALAGAVGTLFLDTHFAGDWGGLAMLFLLQWLFAAAAVAFAFLMIFLVRNVSLGIVLVFFLPALFEGLYSLWRATTGLKPLNRINAVLQALELRGALEAMPRYFFTSNLYAPARRPLVELSGLLGLEGAAEAGPLATILSSEMPLAHSGMVMLGYFLLFTLILAWLFLRRDVD